MCLASGIADSTGALGDVNAGLRFFIAHGAEWINAIRQFDTEILALRGHQFDLHCDFPDFGHLP